jgi:hypothetical protein
VACRRPVPVRPGSPGCGLSRRAARGRPASYRPSCPHRNELFTYSRTRSN